jgi:hypothetical protein
MKKEVRKYTVTYKASEDNIKGIGSNRWLRKHEGHTYIFMGIIIIIGGLALALDKEQTRQWGWWLVLPIIIGGVWFYYNLFSSGKKFWDKVKYIKEPINLDEVE